MNGSILELGKSIVHNKNLIWSLAKRNVVGKYKGSFFGLFWSFLNPLILLSIYTFAFSVVFKAKWGMEDEGHFDFALILFASLTIFNVFSETISGAPTVILGNPNFVKKVVFPLEILPIVNFVTAIIHFSLSLSIFFLFFFTFRLYIPWTIIFLPVVLIPLSLISIGLSYFLAAVGVYVRDIGFFIGHFLQIMLFTSPVFYSLDRIPPSIRKIVFLNPVAYILENARYVLVFGKIPSWKVLTVYSCLGLLTLVIGFYVFQKLRKGFADVI